MKEPQETQVQSLGWEGSLEEGMATHSSTLQRRIPWTEEPGGLPFKASHRVAHDQSDLAHMYTYIPSFSDVLPLSVTTEHGAEFPA